MKTRPLIPILILAALGVASSPTELGADELLRRLPWDPLIARSTEGIRLVEDDRYGQVLEITSDQASGLSTTVLRIQAPGITGQRYAIRGQVRYEEIEGQGHLEMWSVFADGSRYFSKTLSKGPAGPLSGSADWRPFILPFDLGDAPEKPTALTVGVVLPGRGTLRLHDLELHQPDADHETESATSSAWWSDRQAAIGGGIGGAAIGTLASFFAWLASRGRARAVVLAGVTALITLAAGSLVAGFLAIVLGQPYPVYYPLLLLGGLGVLIMPSRLRTMRKQYTDIELRRMQRHDIGTI